MPKASVGAAMLINYLACHSATAGRQGFLVGRSSSSQKTQWGVLGIFSILNEGRCGDTIIRQKPVDLEAGLAGEAFNLEYTFKGQVQMLRVCPQPHSLGFIV